MNIPEQQRESVWGDLEESGKCLRKYFLNRCISLDLLDVARVISEEKIYPQIWLPYQNNGFPQQPQAEDQIGIWITHESILKAKDRCST